MTGTVGQRRTRQRDAILEAITAAEGPLSVPDILERARSREPRLSLATVYRTLAALRDAALISEVNLPGAEPRFEPFGRGHHHHFQCRRCGRVFELDGACALDGPLASLAPAGFRVHDHHLTLYGLCDACVRAA